MLKFIFQSFLKKYYLNEVDQDTYKKHQSNSQSGYSYKKECICPFVLMNSWIDKFQRHHLWNWQQIYSYGEILFHLDILRGKFLSEKKIKKKKKIFLFLQGVIYLWRPHGRGWLIYCSFLWMREGGHKTGHFLWTSQMDDPQCHFRWGKFLSENRAYCRLILRTILALFHLKNCWKSFISCRFCKNLRFFSFFVGLVEFYTHAFHVKIITWRKFLLGKTTRF